MSELDDIYGRMLTFMGGMGGKYIKLKPLTTELSRALPGSNFRYTFTCV